MAIDRHFLIAIVRRWLYVTTIITYVFGILLPLSVVSYLTFYKTLIPDPKIAIPLQFQDPESIRVGPTTVSNIDLSSYQSQFRNLNYLVNLNIETLCNRNRIDDIYPILSRFQLGTIDKSTQFILNCDARYIYHENNMLIPYNLRFWSFPFLTNINKNVNVNSNLFYIDGKDLFQQLKASKVVNLSINKNLIINHENTFLEFLVQYEGFRYYITKYYYRSMIVGVLIFWVISSLISFVTVLIVLSNNTPKDDFKKEVKTEVKTERDDSSSIYENDDR